MVECMVDHPTLKNSKCMVDFFFSFQIFPAP